MSPKSWCLQWPWLSLSEYLVNTHLSWRTPGMAFLTDVILCFSQTRSGYPSAMVTPLLPLLQAHQNISFSGWAGARYMQAHLQWRMSQNRRHPLSSQPLKHLSIQDLAYGTLAGLKLSILLLYLECRDHRPVPPWLAGGLLCCFVALLWCRHSCSSGCANSDLEFLILLCPPPERRHARLLRELFFLCKDDIILLIKWSPVVSFLHSFSCKWHNSILLYGWKNLTVHIYNSFIHSSDDGHLGWFGHLAIMNSTDIQGPL